MKPKKPHNPKESSVANASLRAQNARLQSENKQLRLLLQISQEFAQAPSLDLLLDRAMAVCREHLGFEAAIVRLIEGENLVTRVSYGFPAPTHRRAIRLGEGWSGLCALRSQPVRVGDIAQDDRYVEGIPGAKSLLCVPLVSEGEVLGILNVESRKPDAFDQQVMDITTALGAQLGARLRITALGEKMAQMALTDQLTGLPNYPHLLHRLEEEISRADRYGQPLSLILMDLDDFKQVNDRHGHLCGNFLLEFLGRFLREKVRKSDVAARFGGEEFCILLPHTTPQQAMMVAEKLRIALNKVRLDYLPHVGEPVMDLRLSATFGVSGLMHDRAQMGAARGRTPGVNLICEADDALYRGKAEGKNRVVVYNRSMAGQKRDRRLQAIVGGALPQGEGG